jgi:hypothetical protein
VATGGMELDDIVAEKVSNVEIAQASQTDTGRASEFAGLCDAVQGHLVVVSRKRKGQIGTVGSLHGFCGFFFSKKKFFFCVFFLNSKKNR